MKSKITLLIFILIAALAFYVYQPSRSMEAFCAESMHFLEHPAEVFKPKSDVVEETVSKASKKSDSKHRKFEIPARIKHVPERIVEHLAYTLSFNREHNNPNWVAWELTKVEAEGQLPRDDDFRPDPLLPENHQVETADYKNSGYDRGHMAPAADMKWSSKAMSESFLMSNMCPQTHALNAGAWETLESACRRWAKNEGSVYIVCGPVYKKATPKTIGKDLKISVPDGFFKVVLSLREGKEKAIGFYFDNNKSKQSMERAAMSVDDVEALTGIDFFVNVNDRLEERLESTYALKQWK